MNILNFISDLRTVDIIILVLVVFIFIFLVFLSSSLMKKNRELRKELTGINNKNIHEDSLLEDEDVYVDEDLLEDLILEQKEEDITEILEDLPEITEPGPYKKNVLREISARSQTSPVNIGNSTVDMPKVKVTSYVKHEKNNEEKNNNYNVDNKTFVEEISKKMEEELKPQTIELTDYEKKQEEEAIISYQELLKVKNRTYRINDDEEIETFIDELKDFRNDLE